MRLVAPFDNLLFSHADRRRVMDPSARRLLFSEKNGALPGAVLVDGFVAGSWRLVEERRELVLTVEAFTRLSKSTRAELESEVNRLLERAASPGAGTGYRLKQPN